MTEFTDMERNLSTEQNSDEESNPIVTLKKGVNCEELVEGTEFEIDLSDIEKNEEVLQYDSSNGYKFFKEDVLDKEGQNDDDCDDLSQFEQLAAKMENLTIDGGVKKQMLQQGVGDVVPSGAYVTVHYSAYLEDADEPFDSSRLRQTAQSFDLGLGQVLLGFELAVASMRKKEQARFLIGPSYGLGESGCPPRIPGGATCLFVIELLNFVDIGGVGDYFSLPMSERNDAPFELVMKAVQKTKQEAKCHFENKRYRPARAAYRKALNIFESYHLKNDEEEAKQNQALLQMYQNLAVCSLKLGLCGQVIQSANEALRIEPNSYKAIYLKGKALHQQGEFEKAKIELSKAHLLHPKSKQIREELQRLEESSRLFLLDEKLMYKRMFAQSEESKQEKVASQEISLKNYVDSEILQMFSEKLKMFIDDPELMEIPYSTVSHTPLELDSIEAVAKKMGLRVLRKQQGNIVHIRICKHN